MNKTTIALLMFCPLLHVWKKTGSPQNPTAEQIAGLEKAGQLQMMGSPQWVTIKNGASAVSFDLPRLGVSLIKMTW